MKHALQSLPSSPRQSDRRAELPARRCYSAAEIIAFLGISERGFYKLKRRNKLPFLQELTPRLGRTVRYRADLVDRYLAGQWESTGRRFFSGAQRHERQSRSAQQARVSPISGHSRG